MVAGLCDDFILCFTSHNPRCFTVGDPFTLCRKNGKGLYLLQHLVHWPNFIYEACTVRQITQRELQSQKDLTLMCLEWMRLLDILSSWREGTYKTYKSKFRMILSFESFYDFTILRPTVIDRPPDIPDILLQWCQIAYSTEPSTRKSDAELQLCVAFNTILQLRSAASQYFALDYLVTHPLAAFVAKEQHLLC